MNGLENTCADAFGVLLAAFVAYTVMMKRKQMAVYGNLLLGCMLQQLLFTVCC